MSKDARQSQWLLGIEGGGTRATAALGARDGSVVRQQVFGPGNLRLLSDAQLLAFFAEIARFAPSPIAIGIGLAGLRTDTDRARVAKCVAKLWSGIPFRATHDLEIALRAAASPRGVCAAQVLVLAGTGSCCFGQTVSGASAKIGGWGHIIGDKGSGYELGLRALKACVYYHDRDERWSRLGQRILRVLLLNQPEDLIAWVQAAPKSDIAALAPEVFDAAAEGDRIARDILEGAASSLAKDALAVAKRLKARTGVRFVFAGNVLVKQPKFARAIAKLIRETLPDAQFTTLESSGVRGALKLAAEALAAGGTAINHRGTEGEEVGGRERELVLLRKSPTEMRNPRSVNLHKMSVTDGVELMLSEEAKVPRALLKHRHEIARLIAMVVHAFRNGGRLFYVGAGTSGRLGVLDASECPPTFSVAPDLVQGIIAGGQRALWQAVEGAEDDASAGERAIHGRGVTKKDVVVGIAASGRTPFVWGALHAAKSLGARIALICFNPHLLPPIDTKPEVVIAADVEPEILTGSTRLKAGTATKLILNTITTLAMVQLGKVHSNLMIDLHPSNAKLRDRAIRIVMEITGVPRDQAEVALRKSKWSIKSALEGVPKSRRRV